MKSIRVLAACLLLVLWAMLPGVVSAGDSQQRLAGTWEEFSPSHNFVRFGKDGSWELYLKKGEIGELRSLTGSWKLSDDGALAITMVIGEASRTLRARVEFRGKEMVVIDAQGTETRHRRHDGELPAAYRW